MSELHYEAQAVWNALEELENGLAMILEGYVEAKVAQKLLADRWITFEVRARIALKEQEVEDEAT
jgi:hypothetical protein